MNIIKLLAVFCYILIISIILRDFYYNDASFLVTGYGRDLINNYLFLWSDRYLGTDTLLEKIRGLSIFILNIFGLFKPMFYYLLFFILGFFSIYRYLSLFKVNTNKKIILSILFILNPFTIYHLNHFLIIQGVFITPILLYLYYKYLVDIKYINIYLLLFLPLTLLLGQPHNYSNLIVIVLFGNLLLFFINYKFFKEKIYKNLFLLASIVLFYFFFLYSFFGIGNNNSLLSSTEHFSTVLPNVYWSKNSNIFDFFQLLNIENITKAITDNVFLTSSSFIFGFLISFIIIIIIFSFIFTYKKNNKKCFILGFLVLSLSTVLVHKINIDIINNILYFLMPHITVSTNYAVPIFLITLITLFVFSKNNKIIYLLVIIIQIFVVLTLLFSNIFNGSYNYFLDSFEKDVNKLKSYKVLGYELILPLSAKNNIDAFDYDISLSIFNFDNFTFKHISLEQMIGNTKNSISDDFKQNINNIFLNYPFYKFVTLSESNIIEYGIKNGFLEEIYGYSNFKVYENKQFLGLIRSNNLLEDNNSVIYFNRNNPINYNLKINNLNHNQVINFLESFHTGWKFYLGEGKLDSSLIESKYITNNQNIIECRSINKSFDLNKMILLNTKPLFDNTHKKIYNYANSWTISKKGIIDYVNKYYGKELEKEGYPKKLPNGQIDYKYYKLNPDGSIDVELTLYFKPQLYFYIGLAISVTTFILLLLYLGYDFVKERRKKTNKNLQMNNLK